MHILLPIEKTTKIEKHRILLSIEKTTTKKNINIFDVIL